MPAIRQAQRPPRSLAVISAPRHYRWDDRLWSYGPYAKEIDLWAELFDEIRIVGPVRVERPPQDAVPFGRDNIVTDGILETGGPDVAAKLRQILLLPVLVAQLLRRMASADAVHVRSPANIALLASLLAPFVRRPAVAKYAGQWTPYPGERRLVALQRWLLRRFFPGPVTVYGSRPDDPPHVVDFFTSMLRRDQVEAALEATAGHRFRDPLRILFCGRLFEGKGLLELIRAVASVGADHAVELRIVGDGPLRGRAEALVRELDLSATVSFLGATDHETALDQFAAADVLVLASKHEGWPKVLTEAMVHHCLCIAPEGGLMGRMVAGRGLALDGTRSTDIERALRRVLRNPREFEALLPEAAAWASRHSTEGLRDAIRELLEDRWNTRLAGT